MSTQSKEETVFLIEDPKTGKSGVVLYVSGRWAVLQGTMTVSEKHPQPRSATEKETRVGRLERPANSEGGHGPHSRTPGSWAV